MEQIPSLSDPRWFIVITLAVFLIVIGRYLLIAGIFYAVFYKWYPAYWQQRKINSRSYKKSQLLKEIKWSTLTSIIFALSGSLSFLLWQKGKTKVYMAFNQYPAWWLPVSLIIALVLHETYYYWLHRWMHRPDIFKKIHKVHHDSNITSPFTAFSFHPAEGVLQAIFLPLLIIVMPMHIYVILVQLTIMTLSSVINHLDIELYPATFHKHWFGKWLIGASHHSLHHKQFRFNYGLYFTFWDKFKKTESPSFKSLFEEKTKYKAKKKTAN